MLPNATQRSNRSPSLNRRVLPMCHILRKCNRVFGKPHLYLHPPQPKKFEDMRQHLRIAPPTDVIRHTHISPILFRQSVLNMCRCNWGTTLQHLRKQPAMELQQSAAIARRTFGEKHNRKPRIDHSLHPFARLHRRTAMPSRNINRSRHRGHPPKNRHRRNLRLRDKNARMHRRKHHNIHIAQMVRDHRSARRKSSHNIHINFQSLQRSRTEPVQPVRSFLSRRWLLHQQFRSVSNEVARQMNASR